MNIVSKITLLLILGIGLTGLAAPATAMAVDTERDEAGLRIDIEPRYSVTQRDGMSLSEAVESVRRRGNVQQVISAETRVSGGREVHHIKVLTTDGRVQTLRIPGRRL